MKVKKLIKKLYSAIIAKDKLLESKIYQKILKKSLKKKKTYIVY